MNLRTFIERPVLSAVISITIVVVGIIGLFSLPVEQYPDIAPPTIMVSTSYFGASAETLQKSVIAPLEEAINGVEDMTYMTSSATNAGSVTITVYFKQGTDPDIAPFNKDINALTLLHITYIQEIILILRRYISCKRIRYNVGIAAWNLLSLWKIHLCVVLSLLRIIQNHICMS